MNSGRFDRDFDDAFERAVASLPDDEVSKKRSWNKVQHQVKAVKKRNKRRRHLQIASIALVSAVIGGFLFRPPSSTEAISPIYRSVTEWGEGVVKIVFGTRSGPKKEQSTEGALTPPPPPDPIGPDNIHIYEEPVHDVTITNLEPEYISLEEAKERLSFQIPDMTIPAQFELESVQFMDVYEKGEANDLVLNYFLGDSEILLTVMFRKMTDNMTITSSGSERTREVTWNNGLEGYFTPGRFNSIEFMYKNIHIRMYGSIDVPSLFSIAESIKPPPN